MDPSTPLTEAQELGPNDLWDFPFTNNPDTLEALGGDAEGWKLKALGWPLNFATPLL